jgi:hypothetical protein
MKTIRLFLLIGTAIFATGCPKSKPNVPDVLAKRVALYEISKFDTDLAAYDSAVGANQPEQARRFRDRTINRLKANIDANYHEFENQLFTGRATTNVLADIVELGAAAAINITNGERAKDIIAVLLTGFKGGRKSIDENFFKERTTAAIISQMQASRAHIEAEMLKNLREQEVKEYSLDAALGDLINYFYAGTLQKGLQDLAQQAGKSAITEKANADDQRQKLRAGTPEGVARAQSIRDRFNELFKDANTAPIDLNKQAAAVLAAKQALQELTGRALVPNISNTELFTQLDAEIEAIAVDEAGIQRVRKALKLSN